LTSAPSAATKQITVNLPASTQNTGLPLQIEWEIEFEAARFQTDFPVSATPTGPATLIFLRTGSDFELRSPSNAAWIVNTGLNLSDFNNFRIRSTFNGTTHTQQLFLNGSATPFATRNPTTAAIGAQTALFALGSSVRAGGIKFFKYTDFVTPANSRMYDAGASGGTGNILPETLNGFNGTQTGTWPANNDEWVFYSAGGATPFTGTIGKTTLSPSTKRLSITTGFSSSTNRRALSVSNKQLGVVAGVSLGVGKQALILNTKPEFIQAGAVVTNGKQNYPLATKQLAVVVGNNIPFTGTINKSSYALSGKQLAVQAGWNSGLTKQSLLLQSKQESVNAGALFNINEQHINLNTKGLSLVTGTSISYVGELNKGSLSTVGKPLSIVTGTAIPFIGNIQKTSLSLSGKALSLVNGQILDIQKRSLNLVTKQLSFGETVYPIIPVERLFTIKDGDRVFLMKQVTTIYIMKNN